MRRDSRLIELSREHHLALRLAKRLLADSPGLPDAGVLAELARETPALLRHFAQEEHELLPPLLGWGETALADRLLDEHRQIREWLQATDAVGLSRLADLLQQHVRFEERELFEVMQRYWANAGCAGSTG